MGDYTRLDHRKGQKELAEFPALDVPRCEEQANALFKPYLFFKNGEGTRELSCSACRKFGTFDVPARTETPELAAALYGRHNTRAKCPWCGALCELKERRYIQQGLSLLEYHAVVFLDERDGELFAQAFWTKKEHWQGMSAKELTAAPVFKQTAAYRFRLGHATMYYEGYSGMHKREVTGNFGKQHWLQEPFSTNSWHPTGLKYLVYHVYNWEALERSELRYCQYGSFHKDQKGYTDENLHGDFIKYLTAYTSYPRPMEMLMKIGHEELIKDLLYKRVKNVRVIDWKQEDIRKALGLSGQEVKAWMDAKSKAYDIGYYKQLKKKGVKVGFEELTDLYRAIPCRYTEALQNCIKRNIAPEKLRKYLIRQDGKEGRREFVYTLWRDHLESCEKLGYDTNDETVLFPKDLKRKHDEAAEERRRRLARLAAEAAAEEPMRCEKRIAAREKKYNVEINGFVFRVAETTEEIVNEGTALHHCVGGYAERHMAGKLTICFMRRVENPEASLYTIEMKDESMQQVHGLYNCNPKPEAREALNVWLAWIGAGSKRDKAGNAILPQTIKEAKTA